MRRKQQIQALQQELALLRQTVTAAKSSLRLQPMRPGSCAGRACAPSPYR